MYSKKGNTMYSIVDKSSGTHYASFTTLKEACDAFAEYVLLGITQVTIIAD